MFKSNTLKLIRWIPLHLYSSYLNGFETQIDGPFDDREMVLKIRILIDGVKYAKAYPLRENLIVTADDVIAVVQEYGALFARDTELQLAQEN